MSKQRLSASVDSDLVEAAEAAVKKGQSESVNAWVNEALRLKLVQERRLEALEAFVAGKRDVIDAALVLLAEDGDLLLTSDPDDLEPLAAAAGLHVDVVSV